MTVNVLSTPGNRPEGRRAKPANTRTRQAFIAWAGVVSTKVPSDIDDWEHAAALVGLRRLVERHRDGYDAVLDAVLVGVLVGA